MQPPIVPLQLVPFAFDPLELAAQSFRSLAPPILRLGPTSCLTLHTTFMAYSLSKYNPIIWIAGPDPVTSYDPMNMKMISKIIKSLKDRQISETIAVHGPMMANATILDLKDLEWV